MESYEIRVNYTDGTFSVERVTAGSIPEALAKVTAIVPADEVTDTQVLCVVAAGPIEPLVVFN